eukprot:XP_012813456.1 PREDICTED: protein SON isoform X1 [Xenopus tropicalis]
MATNIEQIFRSFVVNKFKEIQEEKLNSENSETSQNGELTAQMSGNPSEETITGVQDKEQMQPESTQLEQPQSLDLEGEPASKELKSGENSSSDEVKKDTSRKKSKKHKKHKSKKKKKKKKKEKSEKRSRSVSSVEDQENAPEQKAVWKPAFGTPEKEDRVNVSKAGNTAEENVEIGVKSCGIVPEENMDSDKINQTVEKETYVDSEFFGPKCPNEIKDILSKKCSPLKEAVSNELLEASSTHKSSDDSNTLKQDEETDKMDCTVNAHSTAKHISQSSSSENELLLEQGNITVSQTKSVDLNNKKLDCIDGNLTPSLAPANTVLHSSDKNKVKSRSRSPSISKQRSEERCSTSSKSVTKKDKSKSKPTVKAPSKNVSSSSPGLGRQSRSSSLGRRQRSRSSSVGKRKYSRSNSPVQKRKSRSSTPARRSKSPIRKWWSKSITKRERTVSISPVRRRRSRTRSVARRRRSRTRSTTRKHRSRTRSVARRRRSKTRSVARRHKSGSRSSSSRRKSKSRSASRRRRQRSRSASRRRKSRSLSVSRRRRSQSRSVARGEKSQSMSLTRRRRSRSRSAARRRKSKSASATRSRRLRSASASRRRRSRSGSVSRRQRSRSGSAGRRRRSRSGSAVRRRRSRSESASRRRRSRSGSAGRRRRSRSGSAGRRRQSRSGSPGRRRRSRSCSTGRRKRSRSGSAVRRRRSRSGSAVRRRKSRSGSAVRRRRSRSGSASRRRRSRSASASRRRRSRSASASRRRRSRSVSAGRRWRSRSGSAARRRRSRSGSAGRRHRTGSRSAARRRKSRSCSATSRSGSKRRSFSRSLAKRNRSRSVSRSRRQRTRSRSHAKRERSVSAAEKKKIESSTVAEKRISRSRSSSQKQRSESAAGSRRSRSTSDDRNRKSRSRSAKKKSCERSPDGKVDNLELKTKSSISDFKSKESTCQEQTIPINLISPKNITDEQTVLGKSASLTECSEKDQPSWKEISTEPLKPSTDMGYHITDSDLVDSDTTRRPDPPIESICDANDESNRMEVAMELDSCHSDSDKFSTTEEECVLSDVFKKVPDDFSSLKTFESYSTSDTITQCFSEQEPDASQVYMSTNDRRFKPYLNADDPSVNLYSKAEDKLFNPEMTVATTASVTVAGELAQSHIMLNAPPDFLQTPKSQTCSETNISDSRATAGDMYILPLDTRVQEIPHQSITYYKAENSDHETVTTLEKGVSYSTSCNLPTICNMTDSAVSKRQENLEKPNLKNQTSVVSDTSADSVVRPAPEHSSGGTIQSASEMLLTDNSHSDMSPQTRLNTNALSKEKLYHQKEESLHDLELSERNAAIIQNSPKSFPADVSSEQPFQKGAVFSAADICTSGNIPNLKTIETETLSKEHLMESNKTVTLSKDQKLTADHKDMQSVKDDLILKPTPNIILSFAEKAKPISASHSSDPVAENYSTENSVPKDIQLHDSIHITPVESKAQAEQVSHSSLAALDKQPKNSHDLEIIKSHSAKYADVQDVSQIGRFKDSRTVFPELPSPVFNQQPLQIDSERKRKEGSVQNIGEYKNEVKTPILQVDIDKPNINPQVSITIQPTCLPPMHTELSVPKEKSVCLGKTSSTSFPDTPDAHRICTPSDNTTNSMLQQSSNVQFERTLKDRKLVPDVVDVKQFPQKQDELCIVTKGEPHSVKSMISEHSSAESGTDKHKLVQKETETKELLYIAAEEKPSVSASAKEIPALMSETPNRKGAEEIADCGQLKTRREASFIEPPAEQISPKTSDPIFKKQKIADACKTISGNRMKQDFSGVESVMQPLSDKSLDDKSSSASTEKVKESCSNVVSLHNSTLTSDVKNPVPNISRGSGHHTLESSLPDICSSSRQSRSKPKCSTEEKTRGNQVVQVSASSNHHELDSSKTNQSNKYEATASNSKATDSQSTFCDNKVSTQGQSNSQASTGQDIQSGEIVSQKYISLAPLNFKFSRTFKPLSISALHDSAQSNTSLVNQHPRQNVVTDSETLLSSKSTTLEPAKTTALPPGSNELSVPEPTGSCDLSLHKQPESSGQSVSEPSVAGTDVESCQMDAKSEPSLSSSAAKPAFPHLSNPLSKSVKQRQYRSRSMAQDSRSPSVDRGQSPSKSGSSKRRSHSKSRKRRSRSKSLKGKHSSSSQGRKRRSPSKSKTRKRQSPSKSSSKRRSRSKSIKRHSRSQSRDKSRRSRSKSTGRRKQLSSKSPTRKKRSHSRSDARKRHSRSRKNSRSKSPIWRNRSHSKSLSRSPSKSLSRRHHSKSRLPKRYSRSGSRSASPGKHSRRRNRSFSKSPPTRRGSRSRSRGRWGNSKSSRRGRSSRSQSASRRNRSRSRSRRSRSLSDKNRGSRSPVRKRHSSSRTKQDKSPLTKHPSKSTSPPPKKTPLLKSTAFKHSIGLKSLIQKQLSQAKLQSSINKSSSKEQLPAASLATAQLPASGLPAKTQVLVPNLPSKAKLPETNLNAKARPHLASQLPKTQLPLPNNDTRTQLSVLNTNVRAQQHVTDLTTETPWSVADLTTGAQWSIPDMSTGGHWGLSDMTAAGHWTMQDMTSAGQWAMPDLSSGSQWPVTDMTSSTHWPLSDMSSGTQWPVSDLSSGTQWPVSNLSSGTHWPVSDMATAQWHMPDLGVGTQWHMPDLTAGVTMPEMTASTSMPDFPPGTSGTDLAPPPAPMPDLAPPPPHFPDLAPPPAPLPDLAPPPAPLPDLAPPPAPLPDLAPPPAPLPDLAPPPAPLPDLAPPPAPLPDLAPPPAPLPDLASPPAPLPDLAPPPAPFPDLAPPPAPFPDLAPPPAPLPDLAPTPAPLPDLALTPASLPDLAPTPAPLPDLAAPPPASLPDLAAPPPAPLTDLAAPPPAPLTDLAAPPPAPLPDLAAPPAYLPDLAPPPPLMPDLMAPPPAPLSDLAAPPPAPLPDLAAPPPAPMPDLAPPPAPMPDLAPPPAPMPDLAPPPAPMPDLAPPPAPMPDLAPPPAPMPDLAPPPAPMPDLALAAHPVSFSHLALSPALMPDLALAAPKPDLAPSPAPMPDLAPAAPPAQMPDLAPAPTPSLAPSSAEMPDLAPEVTPAPLPDLATTVPVSALATLAQPSFLPLHESIENNQNVYLSEDASSCVNDVQAKPVYVLSKLPVDSNRLSAAEELVKPGLSIAAMYPIISDKFQQEQPSEDCEPLPDAAEISAGCDLLKQSCDNSIHPLPDIALVLPINTQPSIPYTCTYRPVTEISCSTNEHPLVQLSDKPSLPLLQESFAKPCHLQRNASIADHLQGVSCDYLEQPLQSKNEDHSSHIQLDEYSISASSHLHNDLVSHESTLLNEPCASLQHSQMIEPCESQTLSKEACVSTECSLAGAPCGIKNVKSHSSSLPEDSCLVPSNPVQDDNVVFSERPLEHQSLVPPEQDEPSLCLNQSFDVRPCLSADQTLQGKPTGCLDQSLPDESSVIAIQSSVVRPCLSPDQVLENTVRPHYLQQTEAKTKPDQLQLLETGMIFQQPVPAERFSHKQSLPHGLLGNSGQLKDDKLNESPVMCSADKPSTSPSLSSDNEKLKFADPLGRPVQQKSEEHCQSTVQAVSDELLIKHENPLSDGYNSGPSITLMGSGSAKFEKPDQLLQNKPCDSPKRPLIEHFSSSNQSLQKSFINMDHFPTVEQYEIPDKQQPNKEIVNIDPVMGKSMVSPQVPVLPEPCEGLEDSPSPKLHVVSDQHVKPGPPSEPCMTSEQPFELCKSPSQVQTREPCEPLLPDLSSVMTVLPKPSANSEELLPLKSCMDYGHILPSKHDASPDITVPFPLPANPNQAFPTETLASLNQEISLRPLANSEQCPPTDPCLPGKDWESPHPALCPEACPTAKYIQTSKPTVHDDSCASHSQALPQGSPVQSLLDQPCASPFIPSTDTFCAATEQPLSDKSYSSICQNVSDNRCTSLHQSLAAELSTSESACELVQPNGNSNQMILPHTCEHTSSERASSTAHPQLVSVELLPSIPVSDSSQYLKPDASPMKPLQSDPCSSPNITPEDSFSKPQVLAHRPCGSSPSMSQEVCCESSDHISINEQYTSLQYTLVDKNYGSPLTPESVQVSYTPHITNELSLSPSQPKQDDQSVNPSLTDCSDDRPMLVKEMPKPCQSIKHETSSSQEPSLFSKSSTTVLAVSKPSALCIDANIQTISADLISSLPCDTSFPLVAKAVTGKTDSSISSEKKEDAKQCAAEEVTLDSKTISSVEQENPVTDLGKSEEGLHVEKHFRITPPDLLPYDSEQPAVPHDTSDATLEQTAFICQPPPELLPYDSEQPANSYLGASETQSEQASVFHTPPELLPYDSEQPTELHDNESPSDNLPASHSQSEPASQKSSVHMHESMPGNFQSEVELPSSHELQRIKVPFETESIVNLSETPMDIAHEQLVCEGAARCQSDVSYTPIYMTSHSIECNLVARQSSENTESINKSSEKHFSSELPSVSPEFTSEEHTDFNQVQSNYVKPAEVSGSVRENACTTELLTELSIAEQPLMAELPSKQLSTAPEALEHGLSLSEFAIKAKQSTSISASLTGQQPLLTELSSSTESQVSEVTMAGKLIATSAQSAVPALKESALLPEATCKRSRSRSVTKRTKSRSKSISRSRDSRSKSVTRMKRSRSKSGTRKRSRSKSATSWKRSRSKSVAKRQRSQSKTVMQGKRSRSKSVTRRSRSKSYLQRRRSWSKSTTRRKRSQSKSDTGKRRSRSRSVGRKRRSRSRSVGRKRRSRSKSPVRKRHSRSKSAGRKRRSRSKSAGRKNRSRSKSVGRKRRSRSPSTSRRKRSRSVRRRRSSSASVARRRRSRSTSVARRRRSRSTSVVRRRRSRSSSVARRRRSRSVSAGPRRSSRSVSVPRKRRSCSPSVSRRRRTRSPSVSRRRRSRTPSVSRRRRSRSPSVGRRRRSGSTSVTRKGRSRSGSLAHRRRSRSASEACTKRSRSVSATRKKRSVSKSLTPKSPTYKPSAVSRSDRSRSHSASNVLRKRKTRSRSSSRDKNKLSEKRRRRSNSKDHYNVKSRRRSRTPPRRKKSRSPIKRMSPVRRRRSRSAIRRKSFSRSPVRRKRSRSRDKSLDSSRSPKRLTDLDKAQLLEIAKANAAAMCAKAGVPLPPSLKPVIAPVTPVEEKITLRSYGVTIQELTEKCKQIAQSKEDDVIVNKPHDSDEEEEEERPFYNHPFKVSEHKPISFSLLNPSVKPAPKNQVTLTKEFPVSSGSQHRKKEADKVYGEWVPVDKKSEESKDDVFTNTGPSQPVDITSAMNERALAQTRLTGNPFDMEALIMLNRAQEQIDAWAQSTSLPGQFTGSTGAQVLSADEISNSGPQAWLKKDQFLKAAPVTGGRGALLMRKMGWKEGKGLGRHNEGNVDPILIDFKTDRKGLVADGEKASNKLALPMMKDLSGKHPISALMELCNKKKWSPPEFVLVDDTGPEHRKRFLFRVTVNGGVYQPNQPSVNKKLAKATAAAAALQALGALPKESMTSTANFRSASTSTS